VKVGVWCAVSARRIVASVFLNDVKKILGKFFPVLK
jgi:hypothetical protein